MPRQIFTFTAHTPQALLQQLNLFASQLTVDLQRIEGFDGGKTKQFAQVDMRENKIIDQQRGVEQTDSANVENTQTIEGDQTIDGDLIVTGDLFVGSFSIAVLVATVSLKVGSGATITEFDTDGTLTADSDNRVSTQKAVKTYVDTEISTLPGVADATETVKGIAELATQAETDAGTDDTRIVTPLKLANTPVSIPSASETTAGIAELATQTETNAGTDDARIVTPLKLDQSITGRTSAVITAADEIPFSDVGDSNKTKKDTVQGILDLVPSESAATEGVAGIAELATQAETDAGTDDTRIVTPLKLATFSSVQGALVILTANQAIPLGGAVVEWADEVYDTNSFHDNVTNNSRLTVPSGVTWVIVKAQNTWQQDGSGGGANLRGLRITKNGADFQGQPRVRDRNHTSTPGPSVGCASNPLPVTGGDYFEVFAETNEALNILADNGNSTWFGIEVL